MIHSFVTIAIPFDRQHLADVQKYLGDAGRTLRVKEGESGVRQRLDATQLIHFTCVVVVDGNDTSGVRTLGGGRPSAVIILEATVDGGAAPAIAAISAALEADIAALMACAHVSLENTTVFDFLVRNQYPTGLGLFTTPGVNFIGSPGMTVARIKEEARLAALIPPLLEAGVGSETALSTLERVRSHLWKAGEKWAFVADPAPCLKRNELTTFTKVLRTVKAVIAAVAWPVILLPLLALTMPAILTFIDTGHLGSLWWGGAVVTLAIAAVLRPLILLPLAALLLLSILAIVDPGHVGPLSWRAFFVTLGLEVAAGLALYSLFFHREKRDVADDRPPSAKSVEEFMTLENFTAQNHMATVSIMKRGRLRRFTLRAGLLAAGISAAHWSRPGFLGPTGVIHFARWILLPGTDRLVFLSNYDGAWETYLEDFIEQAHFGVTGIWSNTKDFPKTENLFFKGAKDADRFRRWARRQQVPSLFWYTAYPKLTMSRIRTNAAIRQGIANITSEADAADWLACFGSSPRPAARLQTTEMPTLIFGGLRRLRYGACMFVRLSQDRQKNKQWLERISAEVSYGDSLTAERALTIALSANGLRKLGLSNENLATFPVAFQQGNAAPWRARALGDVDNDGPAHWKWSDGAGAETQTDAALLFYSTDEEAIDTFEKDKRKQLKAFGAEIFYRLQFTPMPEKGRVPEPFGYADGVSQPVIRGIRNPQSDDSKHLVYPGEIVLGYPDNLGYTPPSPAVKDSEDPENMLPSVGADLTRQRPDFSVPQPTQQRDLGANGTFLVVRQLEQDVASFDGFLDGAAAALAKDRRAPSSDPKELRDWIGAKMVGRWKDGTSLLRNPHAPGSAKANIAEPEDARRAKPDNDFMFGAEDPDGMRCPFGSHIRRANPRDSFAAGSKEQLDISNRRRILRVGRRYDPQNGLENPGLLFMCLNADIERQFEFIQQSWLLAPNFHGLADEIEPIMGRGTKANAFSIPTPKGTLRIKSVEDFVRVKGGGYFFLPSRRTLQFLARPGLGGHDAAPGDVKAKEASIQTVQRIPEREPLTSAPPQTAPPRRRRATPPAPPT